MKERIIIVALLSAAFLILCGLYLPKPDNFDVQNRRFWAYKTHRKRKQDIIIMGDSRAYRGVSPSEMAKILVGKRILNFGFSSGRLNTFMYNQVNKRLDKESKNRIVVLAVAPNALTEHPKENNHINSQLFLPKEEIYQRLYFAPFLHFFTPLQPNDLFKKKEKKKSNYIQTFHDDGWVESYTIPEDSTSAIKSYIEWFAKVKVSEKLTKELIAQTEKWVKDGVLVFAYRPPSSYTMEQLENNLGNFNEEEIKSRLVQAGAIWIQTNSADYHSYDGSHLHKDSALKLSRHIAEKIKENLNWE